MKPAVPWVLANASPEEAAALRATAPHLIGAVNDRLWGPRFMRALAPFYGPRPPHTGQ